MGHAKDSPEPGRGVPEASGARGGRAEPLEKALGAVERPKGQMLTRGSVPKIRPSRARSCPLCCLSTGCTSSHRLLKIWARLVGWWMSFGGRQNWQKREHLCNRALAAWSSGRVF